MKDRKGFTLAELVLSVLIFSFIAASLATIVSTTNRHVFQNYRKNIIKTNVLLAMKRIQNNLAVATRVDLPLPGTAGNVLAFAVNIDQGRTPPSYPGCYPIIAGPPASWHYFCLASGNLYYHTGTLNTNGMSACGNPAALTWGTGGYGVAGGCGTGGELLISNVIPMLTGTTLFSRHPSDNVLEADVVRVKLRSQWVAGAPGVGLGGSQRDVDFRLDTALKFNISK